MKPYGDEPDTPESRQPQDELARKAYATYLKDGHPEGHAEQNWLEAEGHMQRAGSGEPGHHDHHAHMAVDFRKRFWISLVLTLRIPFLSPLLQTLVGLRNAVRVTGDVYVLFGFASAVFWYGGWPFLNGLFIKHSSTSTRMARTCRRSPTGSGL